MIWIALFFVFLFGCSAVGGVVSFSYHLEFFHLGWPIWAVLAAFFALGSIVFLYWTFKSGKLNERGEVAKLREKMGRFEKEYKQVLYGHLKISILFWTFYYKKEKVKPFDEAKKEVFQDLRRDLPRIKWVDALLEEIYDDLHRYK